MWSDTTGGTVEETNEFENAFNDVDAVIAQNWCRMDDYRHPERNSERAAEFRDWFFTPEVLSDGALFLSNPPVQHDLLASVRLLGSGSNLSGSFHSRRVSVLAASILYALQRYEEGERLALV